MLALLRNKKEASVTKAELTMGREVAEEVLEVSKTTSMRVVVFHVGCSLESRGEL